MVLLSTLPRQFGIILEKILNRHKRSGIAVQWKGGGGVKTHCWFSNVATLYVFQNTWTSTNLRQQTLPQVYKAKRCVEIIIYS